MKKQFNLKNLDSRVPWLRNAVTVAAVVLAVVWLVHLTKGLFDSPDKQQDFRTYQASAQVFHDGGDPYSGTELKRSSDDTSVYCYVYPPQTLPLVEAFFQIPGSSSRYGYFALQVAAIVLLMWLWRKYFLRHPYAVPLLLPFLVCGFSGSASIDITVGNINLLNGCLLWSAFVMYLGRRYGLFVVLIFLAALCKNVEILFLALLLFENDKNAYRWLATGVVCFIALHIGGYLTYPAFYREWLHNVNSLPEWGAINPASLPAIEGAVFGLCHTLGIYDVWGRMGQMVYLAYVLALPIVSWLALRRVDFSRDRIALLMLAIFAYALILPRFKDYSYVLLIAPAAWVILCRMQNVYVQFAATLLVIVPVYKYQPLGAAILFYGYAIHSLRSENSAPNMADTEVQFMQL